MSNRKSKDAPARRQRDEIEHVARRTGPGKTFRRNKTATYKAPGQIAGARGRNGLSSHHSGGYPDVYGGILAIYLAAYRRGALPVLLAHLLAGRRRGQAAPQRAMRLPAPFRALAATVPRAAARIPTAHAAGFYACPLRAARLLSNDLCHLDGAGGCLYLLAAAALCPTRRGACLCRVYAYRRVGHRRGALRPGARRAHSALRHGCQAQTLDLRLYRAGLRLPAENLPAAVPARPLHRGTTGRAAFPHPAATRNAGIFTGRSLANVTRHTALALEKHADLLCYPARRNRLFRAAGLPGSCAEPAQLLRQSPGTGRIDRQPHTLPGDTLWRCGAHRLHLRLDQHR